RTARGGADRVGPPPPEAHAPAFGDHTRAAPVGVGPRRGNELERLRDGEMSDALDRVAQDGALGIELGLVAEMLPIAATADAEDGAEGIAATGAGRAQLHVLAAHPARAPRSERDAHAVAGRRERHEDHAAVRRMAEAVAAGRESDDGELEDLGGGRPGAPTAGRAAPRGASP